MIVLSKNKLDISKLKSIGLALLVITTVSVMLFHFKKTERIYPVTSVSNEETPCPKEETKVIYRSTAQKGEGITHIARRAIESHLKDNNEEIGPERRIYAEDYIKRVLGERDLQLDEEVLISSDLVIEAIELSFELTPPQLENLKVYSSLVFNG